MQELNTVIRRKHAALQLLSSRTLPTLGSDLKVAALLKRYYGPPFAVTDQAAEKLRLRVPPMWSRPDLPPDLAREWQTAVLTQTQEVPDVPDSLKITEKDLPLTLKSENGELNRQGVADIIVALGDLYVDTDPVVK